jgi:hypothetical protein
MAYFSISDNVAETEAIASLPPTFGPASIALTPASFTLAFFVAKTLRC